MTAKETKRLKETKMEVRAIFTTYLEKNKQRRTPERYALLDEIYSYKGHVDVDDLYIKMTKRNYRVSRATVYNTLDLLLDCGLVKKHQFGEQGSQFEQAYGFKQHDHMICVQCKKVHEFCDPRIQQISSKMGELLSFNVTHHSLHLYAMPIKDSDGNCKQCGITVKTEED